MVYSLGQPTNWEELESRFTSFALKPTATAAEEEQFFQAIKSNSQLLQLFKEMINSTTCNYSKRQTLTFKAIFSIIPPYRSEEAIALLSKALFGNSQPSSIEPIKDYLTQFERQSKVLLENIENKNVWRFHESISALNNIRPKSSIISTKIARSQQANSVLWSDISKSILNLDEITKDVFFYAIREANRNIQFIFFKNLVDCGHLTEGRELFKPNRFGEKFIYNIILNNDLEMMQRVLHLCQHDRTLKKAIFPYMFRHAVYREKSDIVRALLQLSFGDIDLKMLMFSTTKEDLEFNPLTTATIDNNLELAEMILDACENNKTLKTLLFCDAPLTTAIATESFEIARAMMKACGDDDDLKRVLLQPDARGKTAIQFAHERQHVEIEVELQQFMAKL